MKITRKREIIRESERRVIITFNDESTENFCLSCQTTARFLTIDEAVVVGQVTARQIFRLIEADRLHFIETENGLLLVCFTSLSNITDESFLLPKKKNQNEY